MPKTPMLCNDKPLTISIQPLLWALGLRGIRVPLKKHNFPALFGLSYSGGFLKVLPKR